MGLRVQTVTGSRTPLAPPSPCTGTLDERGRVGRRLDCRDGSGLSGDRTLAQPAGRHSPRALMVFELCSAATRSNLHFGQVSIGIFALCLGDCCLVPRRYRGYLTGLAVAIKLTPLLFLLYFGAGRQWSYAWRAILAGLLLTGSAFAVDPAATRTYLSSGMGQVRTVSHWDGLGNQSLRAACAAWHFLSTASGRPLRSPGARALGVVRDASVGQRGDGVDPGWARIPAHQSPHVDPSPRLAPGPSGAPMALGMAARLAPEAGSRCARRGADPGTLLPGQGRRIRLHHRDDRRDHAGPTTWHRTRGRTAQLTSTDAVRSATVTTSVPAGRSM